MRHLLIALAVTAVTTSAFAEGEPVHIRFAPGAGSLWHLTEVRTRTSRGEGPESITVATSNGTLTIHTASAQTFDASWVLDSIETRGVLVRNEPSYFIGLPMNLRLDEVGAPIFIEDWSGLRRRTIEAVIQITPEAERTPEWRRGVEGFENIMAGWSESHAAQLFAPLVAHMSLCHETRLRIGETVSGEAQLPNPLGGPPMAATESYLLEEIDRSNGVARLVYTRALDPESATASIRESLILLARQSGRSTEELEREFAGLTITHDSRAECIVDLATGVTTSLVHEVRVGFGPAVRIDRREITVRAAP